MPTTSVIIPTYNRERFIVETVRSVLTQTLQDYEVVVVDDGSTDSTRDALKQFGDSIKYIYQENKGRSSARNCGIENSRDKYILFLDSDDMLLPQALETLSSFLDAHPSVGVVYSDGYYCDESGRNFRKLSSLRPAVDHEKPLETLVLMNFIIAPHSAMVRRSCLDSIGPPYFDETLSGPEDTDLWIRLAEAGCRFEYVDGLICKYRWHGSNTFSPLSETAPQAWQSTIRFKYKILNSGYFHALSFETRYTFFYQLLLHDLKGNPEEQQTILELAQFGTLSVDAQAALWYLVGVDNIINDRESLLGRIRLKRARELAPSCVKYRAVLLASHLGSSILGSVVRVRRKLHRVLMPEPPIRSPFDPRFLQEQDSSV